MSMVTEYAYLNARVSAMAEKLLPEEKLVELLNQPLGQQHIDRNAELDDLLNDEKVDPRLIEQAWFMYLAADFKVLIRSLSGASREFIAYWFHKCEITNLKTIVRGKISGLSPDEITSQLIELGELATLPIEQLLRTEDVSELLRQLDRTHFSTIARQSRRVFEQEHQLHALDAAIDRHYLLGFESRIHALDSTQRKHVIPLMSILMDRFNLLWLLRYRFAYQLSPAETYYLLIPASYTTINRTLLQKLVEFNTLEEIIASLPDHLHVAIGNVEDTYSVEHKLNTELMQVAQYTLRWRSFTIAKAMAFVLLRELEMRRVLAIIKGKRLGLKPGVILGAADAYSTTLMI
jgi:V/A-type H+-transporting ATPase subunit C